MWREASALLAATKMRAAVAELTARWCRHALISASASASPMAKPFWGAMVLRAALTMPRSVRFRTSLRAYVTKPRTLRF
jgi:hypothetical protein